MRLDEGSVTLLTEEREGRWGRNDDVTVILRHEYGKGRADGEME